MSAACSPCGPHQYDDAKGHEGSEEHQEAQQSSPRALSRDEPAEEDGAKGNQEDVLRGVRARGVEEEVVENRTGDDETQKPEEPAPPRRGVDCPDLRGIGGDSFCCSWGGSWIVIGLRGRGDDLYLATGVLRRAITSSSFFREKLSSVSFSSMP